MKFREFIKKEESSYFDSLYDQLGINPEDYKKEPQIASFFSLGSTTVNIGPYQILDYKKNENGEITHVLVKQINDPKIHNVKYRDDKKVKDNVDKKFLIPFADFQKLLLQSQNQPSEPQDSGGIV